MQCRNLTELIAASLAIGPPGNCAEPPMTAAMLILEEPGRVFVFALIFVCRRLFRCVNCAAGPYPDLCRPGALLQIGFETALSPFI